MTVHFRKLAAALTLALTLSGCLTLERPEHDYPVASNFSPDGFTDIRLGSGDPTLAARLEADIRADVQGNASRFDVLALSGGGADGAFGAGVLLGWTKRGDRPSFRLVTGVSTGALIAPFAYLGPAYDERLKEAYTSGAASGLSKSRGFLSLFTPGLLDSNALHALVARYVDDRMVADIAREHAKGRQLLVATTNLDAQTGVIWDIGEIATQGTEGNAPAGRDKARRLIHQVLVASASVPAAFAPVMIDVERPISGGVQHFREMHVDGSVTLPFFVLPESLLGWKVPADLNRGGRIHVLINGKITPQPAITTYNALAIMGRSLDTLTKAQARTSLIALEGFARRNGMEVSVVSLPDEFIEGGLLAFDTDSMRRVFYYGFQLGASDRLWLPEDAPPTNPDTK